MKKFICILAACIAILISSNYTKAEGYNLFIDGEQKQADVILENSRTFVPLRFISENMGYKVDYDAKTKGIKITNGTQTLELKVGSSKYVKDGVKGFMDVKTFIRNDRTFVPLRFFGEAFSKNVGWDQASGSVYIGVKPEKFPMQKTSEYTAKEFPKFGVKLILPPKFDDKMFIKESDDGERLEIHSKFVDAYKKGEGFVQAYYLSNTYNPEYEDMGMKVEFFSENKYLINQGSMDFFTSSGVYYDDMRECFKIADQIIIVPLAPALPEGKNVSADVKNGNLVYKFGNPQVTVEVPLKNLKDISVKLNERGLGFYDLKNSSGAGGRLFDIVQFKGESELPNVLLSVDNGMSLRKTGPSDVQYRDDVPELEKSYFDKMTLLENSVVVKVGNKTLKPNKRI